MKASLQIETSVDYEDKDEPVTIVLSLLVHGKKEYLLWRSGVLDDTNPISFQDQIENSVNEATILMNAIPGLKLIVDQSIAEFIDGEEEEIRKFVQRLVVEI